MVVCDREKNKNISKMEMVHHCHFTNGYFIPINQFVMRQYIVCSHDFNLGSTYLYLTSFHVSSWALSRKSL